MRSQYEASDSRALPDYPVECFTMEDTSPGIFAASHWHRYSEVLYIRQGSYEVLVNGDVYRLGRGELLYIVPRQIHTTICPDIPRAELTVLKFDPGLLFSAAGADTEKALWLPLSEEAHAPAWHFTPGETGEADAERSLAEISGEIERRAAGYQLAVRGAVNRLMLDLLRRLDARPDCYDAPAHRAESEGFYQVLAYIEEHAEEAIPLPRLLEMCHLSYSNFALKFKRLTGKSYTAYLNSVRVSRAQRLLRGGGMPIAQIAAVCGFSDPCYFDRVFRRCTGVSPSAYRNG